MASLGFGDDFGATHDLDDYIATPAAGEVHDTLLASARLRGADLRGARLFGADLSTAVLDLLFPKRSGSVPSGADLRRARLDGADLRTARLGKAVLIGASLRSARLLSRRVPAQPPTPPRPKPTKRVQP